MMIQTLCFSFAIWMSTSQTHKRPPITGILRAKPWSRGSGSGVLISTLSRYLLDKVNHFTN